MIEEKMSSTSLLQEAKYEPSIVTRKAREEEAERNKARFRVSYANAVRAGGVFDKVDPLGGNTSAGSRIRMNVTPDVMREISPWEKEHRASMAAKFG